MENQSIIQKAAFDLSALSAGGLQNPTQFSNFARQVMAAPTILKEARFMPLNNDRLTYDKIAFGQRVLTPGVEGTQLTTAQQTTPQLSKTPLATQEVIAEVALTYNMLENNIEHDKIQDTVMAMLAERAALDLEELIVNGDTTSTDTYLAMFDGLLKKANTGGHVIDLNGGSLDRTAFLKAKKAMPYQYLRDQAAMRYYVSPGQGMNWEDQLAQRQTPNVGDSAILTGFAPSAYGIKVAPCYNMKSYSFTPSGGSATSCSDILLTAPQNILVGMNRNIRLEVFHDTRGRQFIITMTAKIAVDFAWDDAVVLVKNIAE